jgi:hypothetical protein
VANTLGAVNTYHILVYNPYNDTIYRRDSGATNIDYFDAAAGTLTGQLTIASAHEGQAYLHHRSGSIVMGGTNTVHIINLDNTVQTLDLQDDIRWSDTNAVVMPFPPTTEDGSMYFGTSFSVSSSIDGVFKLTAVQNSGTPSIVTAVGASDGSKIKATAPAQEQHILFKGQQAVTSTGFAGFTMKYTGVKGDMDLELGWRDSGVLPGDVGADDVTHVFEANGAALPSVYKSKQASELQQSVLYKDDGAATETQIALDPDDADHLRAHIKSL